ncbi:hypothetical protein EHS25_008326 [Saitozyma podzolica]|uniref:NOT2/NOT3/NOT5 C-terminal domain-containing protein n=1 Tax=Saitozyma podzolica TaxID=1890683 RepID=A0A427YPA2_9TREE|nr:hypothetical protein EHS25_008326 [Saitozyma podzolica]
MNRPATTQRTQPSIPAGYRPAQLSPAQTQPLTPGSQSSNPMYYATAGQQATTGGPAQGLRGQMPIGHAGFPPVGGIGRGGPPGFASRGAADPNDFPALGSLNPSLQHMPTSSSTYAAQAQPSGGSSTSNPAHLQQQLFMQQGIGALAPPPPPGIAGPATPQSTGTNGIPGENLRGEDFPALGGADKERIGNFLRNPNHQPPPSPPSTLPNGASATHSNSATPSTNPALPSGAAPSTTDSWPRQSPSRPAEPVVRPVQQILSSPVDKWGLKALLYEIKTQMGKGDRGVLLFGEELSELGVDVTSEDPLYPTFVTPWAEPSQIPLPVRVQESFHIPSCYQFPPPSLQAKMPNFTEDTLFLAFYASPGDATQLEAASELFNRGWRYHTELQLWLQGPQLQSIDLPADGQANWVRGPFLVFDPQTFNRQRMPEDFMVNPALLEVTRSAASLIAEDQARKESLKSPNAHSVLEGTPGQVVPMVFPTAAR